MQKKYKYNNILGLLSISNSNYKKTFKKIN